MKEQKLSRFLVRALLVAVIVACVPMLIRSFGKVRSSVNPVREIPECSIMVLEPWPGMWGTAEPFDLSEGGYFSRSPTKLLAKTTTTESVEAGMSGRLSISPGSFSITCRSNGITRVLSYALVSQVTPPSKLEWVFRDGGNVLQNQLIATLHTSPPDIATLEMQFTVQGNPVPPFHGLHAVFPSLGEEVFTAHCAQCHSAKNGDPKKYKARVLKVPKPVGKAKSRRIRQPLTSQSILDSIDNGAKGMPAFNRLPEIEKQAVVEYVLQL